MDHMPGILDSVKRAYVDLLDVYEHLRSLAIMAFVLSLAVGVIGFFVGGLGLGLFGQMIRLLAHIGFGVVMAPYLIAVHRFIILGKVTERYELEFGDPRLQQFLQWTVALTLLSAAPTLLTAILPLPIFLRVFVTLGLVIAVLVATVRMIVILPAVAVDSEHVTWQNAMADTAGHAGRIFVICLLAGLPIVLVAMVLSAIFAGFGLGLLAFVVVLIQGAAGVVAASLLVVIASRVYEALADRVRA
jgi:hypothetical protein